MPVQRRSTANSNNPFSEALTPESTGAPASEALPGYKNDANTNKYYNSTEKSRDQAARRDLPPSYEEAAGPKTARGGYPKEKSAAAGTNAVARHRSHSDGVERHRSSHRDREHREHREHRDRDRDHRKKDKSKSSSSRDKSKSKKEVTPPKNVDTIDKLDVSGLFGGAFHHDGPFDACTPHRNKNNKAAPVLAFPVDGPNNSIRGMGNNTKEETINYVMGRHNNDFDAGSAGATDDLYHNSQTQSNSTISAIKPDPNITHIDANKPSTPVYGQTTLGLGASTFLDGAPAARKAMDEEAVHRANIGGLNRKKSIRQRLTGEQPDSYTKKTEEESTNSLLKRVKSLKVGRRS